MKITLLIIIISSYCHSQSIELTNIFPGNNSNNADPKTNITLCFSAKIDTVELEDKIIIRGQYNSNYDFTIECDSNLSAFNLKPVKPFPVGEKITVIVTNKIKGYNFENFQGYIWDFRIKPSYRELFSFEKYPIQNEIRGGLIYAANINYDNNIDIITEYGQIFTNDGSGNFTLYQNLYTLANDIWITDSDLDKNTEIILEPYVFEQNEMGYFEYDDALTATKTDFNRDGYNDIVHVVYNDSDYSYKAYLELILSDGHGGYFTTPDTIFYLDNPVDIVFADMNNDGIIDILYATNSYATPHGGAGENAFGVIFLDSSNNILDSVKYKYEDGIYGIGFIEGIQVDDFNNDGFNDVLGKSKTQDFILLNSKNYNFDIVNSPEIGSAGVLKIADINGDGWLDLIYNLTIFDYETRAGFTGYQLNNEGNFSNGFVIEENYTNGNYSLAAADFNGDGFMDIASQYEDGLHLYLNSISDNIYYKKIPEYFHISENYPNPFNHTTTIELQLNKSFWVQSRIYNIRGICIKKFQKKLLYQGVYYYNWDGRNEMGLEVSNGNYYWVFILNNSFLTKKITILN